jgi:hypothetical protein
MNRASAIVGTTFGFDMPVCYADSSVSRSNCRYIELVLKNSVRRGVFPFRGFVRFVFFL